MITENERNKTHYVLNVDLNVILAKFLKQVTTKPCSLFYVFVLFIPKNNTNHSNVRPKSNVV